MAAATLTAAYRDAVRWIALEDGDGDDEAFQLYHVASMVTVQLVATVWGKDDEQVARAVIRIRRQERR